MFASRQYKFLCLDEGFEARAGFLSGIRQRFWPILSALRFLSSDIHAVRILKALAGVRFSSISSSERTSELMGMVESPKVEDLDPVRPLAAEGAGFVSRFSGLQLRASGPRGPRASAHFCGEDNLVRP